MYQALLFMFLLLAIGLITLVMLQQCTNMGTSFSSGGSGTLFGSGGSSSFMVRVTAVLATLFFILSLVLGNINSNHGHKNSPLSDHNQKQQIDKITTVDAQKKVNKTRGGNDIPQ